MDIDELVAREAVRDLVARYNGYGDSGRFDELVTLFAPDAIITVGADGYEGLTAIRRLFTTAAGPAPRRIQHFTSTLRIDVEPPERATARCYFAVVTDQGLDHWGRYRDRFARVDGTWRFTRREVHVDGMTPGGWAAARRGSAGHDAP